MLYNIGNVEAALNVTAHTGPKRKHSKNLPVLKSLNGDKFSFSGATKMNNIINVSFGAKQTQLTPHDNPYVLVHGTIVKEDSMFLLRDFLQPKVSNLDLQFYPNITDGKQMEVCGQDVSRNVNNTRIGITREKLAKLATIKNSPEELCKYFGLKDSGNANFDIAKIAKLIPGVVKDIEVICQRDKSDLLESFSTRVKAVELKLAEKIKKTDFGNWDKANKDQLCDKAAATIIDGIAPKAVLVGLSMGGLVAHIMALNPKKVEFNHKGELKDQSQFTYDAANGIAVYTSLGAPVENGTDMDSAGMREARYDWCNETIVEPIEKAWGGLLSLCPPWLFGKAMFKNGCLQFSDQNDIKPLSNPEHLKEKPALVQMTRDSDFLKKYVIGKHAPAGVSNLSYYHPGDKFMDMDCLRLNEKHTNNHNIKVNFDITDQVVNKARNNFSVAEAMTATMQMLCGMGINLKDEQRMIKSLYAHEVVPLQPQEFLKSFEETILNDPNEAIRMLDLSNSDTLRRQCLDVIYDQLQKEPDYLANKSKLVAKIAQVSAEKVPFESSPSHRADQILEISK